MSELLERARAVVETARKKGAQGARAWVRRSREGSVEWRDGKLDRLRESTEMGLAVALFVDGRYSSNSTSDLRPDAVDKFLDETVAATRVLAPDPHRKLPDAARYANRFAGTLGIYDEAGVAAANGAERARVARELEQAARSAPGADAIISVTATASDTVAESAVVCSNGMEGTVAGTRFSIEANTSVRDAGDRKPEGWYYGNTRQRAKLPTIEAVGREATARALRERQAKPEKSGTYSCIVENWVTSRLLNDLLAPLGGQAIQQKRSCFADKLNKKVAADLLTITDDPLLQEGLASATFDSEGMSSAPRPIIERGVLKTYLLDTYYASKLGVAPTTGATSNLVFPAGKRDLDGLLATMVKGILITGFTGGNSNPATGAFSLGIRGQWIAGGKPVRPVSEMNLSGNIVDLWSRLLELGSDAFPYSSMRCPSLRFDKLQFSGV